MRINHILNDCEKSENTESSLKYWNTIQLEILPFPEEKVIEYLMKNSMGSNIKITVLVPRLASKDLGNHHAHPHKKKKPDWNESLQFLLNLENWGHRQTAVLNYSRVNTWTKALGHKPLLEPVLG